MKKNDLVLEKIYSKVFRGKVASCLQLALKCSGKEITDREEEVGLGEGNNKINMAKC